MNRMRIGDLTERAGVTQRTVRYYESIGLLPSGEREGNGHHYYTEETVTRLQKIDQLKKIGLSLEEIRDVVELYFTDTSGVQPKRKVLGILRRHLADTDQKLEALGLFRSDLQSNIERFERWLEANEGD
ncbi:MerR family transcriptional regulator [Cohnella ginsengisoli]|uniref:MerR family transcriptional regulator n=1 Tax=Cohnella ginsengisoli TaxID=425004 RepID=A0A9X4QQR2_9BACL|nr:MerR family transcriptional regulator [Cohnella ginsengisoli]MDG0795168.1 MerR family transcriptional regulator [Cohnella ginsengisoli]